MYKNKQTNKQNKNKRGGEERMGAGEGGGGGIVYNLSMLVIANARVRSLKRTSFPRRSNGVKSNSVQQLVEAFI